MFCNRQSFQTPENDLSSGKCVETEPSKNVSPTQSSQNPKENVCSFRSDISFGTSKFKTENSQASFTKFELIPGRRIEYSNSETLYGVKFYDSPGYLVAEGSLKDSKPLHSEMQVDTARKDCQENFANAENKGSLTGNFSETDFQNEIIETQDDRMSVDSNITFKTAFSEFFDNSMHPSLTSSIMNTTDSFSNSEIYHVPWIIHKYFDKMDRSSCDVTVSKDGRGLTTKVPADNNLDKLKENEVLKDSNVPRIKFDRELTPETKKSYEERYLSTNVGKFASGDNICVRSEQDKSNLLEMPLCEYDTSENPDKNVSRLRYREDHQFHNESQSADVPSIMAECSKLKIGEFQNFEESSFAGKSAQWYAELARVETEKVLERHSATLETIFRDNLDNHSLNVVKDKIEPSRPPTKRCASSSPDFIRDEFQTPKRRNTAIQNKSVWTISDRNPSGIIENDVEKSRDEIVTSAKQITNVCSVEPGETRKLVSSSATMTFEDPILMTTQSVTPLILRRPSRNSTQWDVFKLRKSSNSGELTQPRNSVSEEFNTNIPDASKRMISQQNLQTDISDNISTTSDVIFRSPTSPSIPDYVERAFEVGSPLGKSAIDNSTSYRPSSVNESAGDVMNNLNSKTCTSLSGNNILRSESPSNVNQEENGATSPSGVKSFLPTSSISCDDETNGKVPKFSNVDSEPSVSGFESPGEVKKGKTGKVRRISSIRSNPERKAKVDALALLKKK